MGRGRRGSATRRPSCWAMSQKVLPSRMALTATKARVKGAQTGHKLLKKKSDALTMKIRQILKLVVENKHVIGDAIAQANWALTGVYYAAGAEVKYQVLQATPPSATVRLSTKVDNVAGVKIPVFQRVDVDAKDSSALVGLARGGQKLEDARTSFKKALDSLVVLASLQTSYVALDAAQKLTNRRVNALEYVVIPRLEDTGRYIATELDEMEREDFVRLKKVQEYKKKRIEEEEEKLAALQEAGLAPASYAVPSMLDKPTDDDDLFS